MDNGCYRKSRHSKHGKDQAFKGKALRGVHVNFSKSAEGKNPKQVSQVNSSNHVALPENHANHKPSMSQSQTAHSMVFSA